LGSRVPENPGEAGAIWGFFYGGETVRAWVTWLVEDESGCDQDIPFGQQAWLPGWESLEGDSRTFGQQYPVAVSLLVPGQPAEEVLYPRAHPPLATTVRL
jgi:hypothetical protein